MNNQNEQFMTGSENLKNNKIALDPNGRNFLAGYLLVLISSDGKLMLTKKCPATKNNESTYKNMIQQLVKSSWNKLQKPNTPSVEMLLNVCYPELDIKAYAMWGVSSNGVNASTYAVYEKLTDTEIEKICDTMSMCVELYDTDNTFIMD